MKFTGRIQNGKPYLFNQSAYNEFFEGLAENEYYELTLEKKKSRRNLDQNALFWVYMTILSKETGFTKDEMADHIRWELLRYEKVNEVTGEVIVCPGHTSKLSKSEFAEFIEHLQRYAAETIGVYLPDPLEQLKAL